MAVSSTVRPTGGSGPEQHQGWWLIAWRKLDLVHDGRPFLRRRGFDLFGDRIGIYLHHIAGADPGLDLHDHPWPFVALVLWGGYYEDFDDVRHAARASATAEHLAVMHAARVAADQRSSAAERSRAASRTPAPARGQLRTWARGSIHVVDLGTAHRIIAAEPRTYTLVIRLPKRRDWGFYERGRWTWWRHYDYTTRRPNAAVSSKTEENHGDGLTTRPDPASDPDAVPAQARGWVISEPNLLDSLRRAHAGDSPDVVLMEITANSETEDRS